MWSYDSNVSFLVKANDSDVSLEKIRSAASREQLNGLYIKAGTLMVLNDGQCKLAYKVSQVGGKSAPFRVSFAASPGSRPVQDTVVNVADLIAATGGGTLDGVKHLLFGYKGGSFRGTDGSYLQVIDAVPAAGRELAFSSLSVIQWETGKRKPAISNATVMGLEDLFSDFLGESLDPVADAVLIPMKETPTVQSVLQASKLLHGHLGEEAELSIMESFLSAVFGSTIKSKTKVCSAAAQLEGLLLGKTANRAGHCWQETSNAGMVASLSAGQAGYHLRVSWFIQLPKLGSPGPKTKPKPFVADEDADESGDYDDSELSSGEEEDDDDLEGVEDVPPAKKKAKRTSLDAGARGVPPASGKRPKAAEDADLAAFVPRCGTLSKLDTARIIFESVRVRKMADCEAVPSDEEAVGSEQRFERRCSKALLILWQVIGKSMVPSKPPRDKRALEDLAEGIYEAASAKQREGLSPVRTHLSAAAASAADEDVVERKPDPPMPYAEAVRALAAAPAARLHAQRVTVEAAFADPLQDPAIAMRAVTDSALRDDLARAMSSNGKVYAPGEQSVSKRNQSQMLHALRQRMIEHVAASVRACAGTDTSCEMYMSEASSIPLAEAAMAGVFKWSTFSAASKAMRKSAASKVGTVFEIAQTFELMEAAWAATMENIYGVTNDSGLRQLRQCLGSTAQTQSAKLPAEQQVEHAKDLLAWLERVTDHFGATAQAFRGGSGVRPDPTGSVASMAQMYSNLAGMSAMAPKMAKWFPQAAKQQQLQQQSQRYQPAGDKKPPAGGPGAQGSAAEKKRKQNANKKRRQKAKKAAAAAGSADEETEEEEVESEGKAGLWTDKPKMAGDQWAKCLAAFKEKWPDACSYHHLNSCKWGASKCRLSHAKVAGFEKWCKEIVDEE